MKQIIIAIAIIAVAIAAWLLFFPSEKKIVLKQLDKIIESVNKPSDEGNIAAAAKNLAFGDFVVQIEDAVAEFDDVSCDGENAFEQHDAIAAVADHDDVAVGWLAPPEGGRPAEDEHAVMIGWFHAGSSDDGRFA